MSTTSKTDAELLAIADAAQAAEFDRDNSSVGWIARVEAAGLRAVAAAAWKEGAEALGASFWDGESGNPGQNPYETEDAK